jgi:hypothetical protein
MADLKNSKAIWAKGGLFLVLGLMSAALLVAEMPSVRVVALLGITVWAFCRAYYFAFYVIEHYVDPEFRFAGLIDFVRYAMRRRMD